MNELEKFIREAITKAIDHVDNNDIYAFSFFVYNDEDDPRRPTLIVGFNTSSNYQKETENASSLEEAKWNYAFWLQNEIAIIGTEEDEAGRAIIQDWITEVELNYTDEEEENDFEKCLEQGEKITSAFVDILIKVVQHIHSSNVTKLPIIIHELEYYYAILEQNIKANGAERVKGFVEWIDRMENEEWKQCLTSCSRQPGKRELGSLVSLIQPADTRKITSHKSPARRLH